MYTKDNGYISGALLLLPHIRKLREHVEFQKFQCRVLKDDDTTREFKRKTEQHKNKLFAFRYNNEESERITAAGKKDASKQ